MSCLEQIFLMTQLIPLPAAPPVFMILFTITMFYSFKPCVYCLILMSLLYLTCSPTSPFGPDPPPFNTTLASSPQPLALPQPDRGWITWNSGRLFDPPLIGYLPPAPPAHSDNDQQDQLDEQPAQPPIAPAAGDAVALSPLRIIRTALFEKWEDHTPTPRRDAQGLPQGYVDWRWNRPGKFQGMGYVFDFGWRRTEQGLRWEGQTGQLPPPPLASDDETAGEGKEGLAGPAEPSLHDAQLTADALASQVGPQGEELASGKGYRWSRVPFVGDL